MITAHQLHTVYLNAPIHQKFTPCKIRGACGVAFTFPCSGQNGGLQGTGDDFPVEGRSAGRAPGHCALRRGKGLPPFPHTPFSASGIHPSLRFGQVLLDEAEHFLHNRDASVAKRSDGVRVQPSSHYRRFCFGLRSKLNQFFHRLDGRFRFRYSQCFVFRFHDRLGSRCFFRWIVFQIRATPVPRSLNFFTGVTLGSAFQISIRRAPGQLAAISLSSASLVKVSAVPAGATSLAAADTPVCVRPRSGSGWHGQQ